MDMNRESVQPISKHDADAVAAFCEELSPPLEEVFSLIYIAAHKRVNAAHRQECLETAAQRLEAVRQVVLSHCSSHHDEKKKAS